MEPAVIDSTIMWTLLSSYTQNGISDNFDLTQFLETRTDQKILSTSTGSTRLAMIAYLAGLYNMFRILFRIR